MKWVEISTATALMVCFTCMIGIGVGVIVTRSQLRSTYLSIKGPRYACRLGRLPAAKMAIIVGPDVPSPGCESIDP